MNTQKHLPTILVVLSVGSWSVSNAQMVQPCGELENAYGPFDYTNLEHRVQKLPIVESGHFNSDVENLIRGQSGTIVGDLEYALRTFPNHPRFLWSMARLHLREKSKQTVGSSYTIDCWFDRGMRMNPKDPTVRYIYGMYLHRAGEKEGALSAYTQALDLDPSNPELHYNMGLLYFDFDQLEQAKFHANEAYSAGFPLPGLRRKLEKKGIDL